MRTYHPAPDVPVPAGAIELGAIAYGGDALFRKGDVPKALETAEQALAAAANEAHKGKSLAQAGFLMHQLGQYGPAETKLRAALEIQERVEAGKTAQGETLISLAMLLRDTRRLPEALKRAEEGRRIQMRELGGNHYLYAEALNIEASIHHMSGAFDEAERIYEQALTIHAAQSEIRPEYGTLCNQLAQLQQRLGHFAKAKKNMDKALEVLARAPGKEHPVYAAVLVTAAFLEQDMGDLLAAERRLVEALPLVSRHFPKNHPARAIAINNLGMLYFGMGNLTRAEEVLRESLALRDRSTDPLKWANGARNLEEY